MKTWIKGLSSLILVIGFCTAAIAQGDIPFHFEPYTYSFGIQNGQAPSFDLPAPGDQVDDGWTLKGMHFDESEYLTSTHIVSSTGAAWMRLYFNDVDLGLNSYITIVSLLDDADQRLDAESMEIWSNASAMFNGDAVEVTLHVAPGDENIRLDIHQIMVGEYMPGDGAGTRSQCGPTDDRVSSTDNAEGRIMPIGCTGWIFNNGAYLTAGHCVDVPSVATILEFEVPSSLSNGTTVASDPDDQYPITSSSIQFQDAGVGDDWGVFDVGTNSNTGYLPPQRFAQNDYFRGTKSFSPTTIRITGYGTDDVPPGSSGFRNADNQTLQTHSGASLGETVVTSSTVRWNYLADTEGGNSGSPVIWEGSNAVTVGIHTNAGCTTSGTGGTTGNQGTGFEADDTESAIDNFPGSIVYHVDELDPGSIQTGYVFYPYKTVTGAYTAMTGGSGHIMSLTKGTYTETITMNKTMILRAPVGEVVIGPGATSSEGAQRDEELVLSSNFDQQSSVITENRISTYPNPFTDVINVNLSLGEETEITLSIYDVFGKEIYRLADAQVFPEGIHMLNMDGSLLAAGVYVLQGNVGDKDFSKKIIKAE